MASSSRRKFLVRHPAVVDVGCSCRRTKLASLFSSAPSKPRPNPHTPPKHHHPLSSYYPFSPSATTTTTNTNFSSGTTISAWETSHHPSSSSTSTYEYSSSPSWKPAKSHSSASKKKAHNSKAVKESVAVVKESDDPYHDFRDSMLQMILEKEIYAWDDLKDLLQRFLSLNSPYHHDSILKAFAEIWNGVFSSSGDGGSNYTAAAVNKPTTPTRRRRSHNQHRHHHRLSRDPMGYST